MKALFLIKGSPLNLTMSCLALKRNGNLCRNYACMDGAERGFTCRQHRAYFDDPEKVKKKWIHPPSRFHRDSVGVGQYLEFYPGHLYHIEESLRLGLVTITKEDIRNIYCEDVRNYSKWAVLLLLILRHTDLYCPEWIPTWHPVLWHYAVKTLWRLEQSIGPMTFTWKDIQNLICFPHNLYLWYRGLEYYPFSEQEVGYTKEDFYRFFEDCLKDEEFHYAFVMESGEEVEKNRKRRGIPWHSNAQKIVESDEFLEWRRKLKASWYAEQKARCDVFKEELMAVCWHPERFMDCLDWEEKRDILGRW